MRKLLFTMATLIMAVTMFGTGNAFGATFTWDGEGVNGNFTTNANWVGDADITTFNAGDSIVFPDYNYAGNNQPIANHACNGISSMTFDSTSSTISLTISADTTMQDGGTISVSAGGGNGVTIADGGPPMLHAAGAVTISNADAGGLLITDHIGGTGTGLITFTGTENITVTGVIVDSGSNNPVTINMAANSDIVSFNAGNTFAGLLTVTSGTLSLGNAQGFGTGAGGISLGGGILRVATTINAAAWTKAINLTNNSAIDFTAAGTVIDELITVGNTYTLTIQGNQPVGFTGGITGAGGVTLNMTGNQAVTINTIAADYTGDTTVTSGYLTTGAANMLTDSGTYSIANDANALIALGGSETIGALSGGGAAGGNIDLGGPHVLTVTQDSDQTYAGNITGGGGGLTKIGANTLSLTGVNTYTSTTNVNAGTLLVNEIQNNVCSGAVIVANNATLGGTGTIKGAITVQTGGIVKPGSAGAGTLTTTTDVTFQGTSKLVVDNAGASFDVLAVGGNLVLPAGTALIELEAGQNYTASNAVVTVAGTYDAANEFDTANMPAGWGINSVANTSISLTYTAPAPTIPTLNEWGMIITMILLAGTAFMAMRRRREGMQNMHVA